MRVRDYFLYSFAIFYLFIGLTAIFNTIEIGNVNGILWLCYMSLFMLSIGMFLQDDGLIISQLNLLIIPLLLWNIDFFSYFILSSQTLLGITNYMFIPGNTVGKLVGLQHVITIPLSLLALYFMPIKSIHSWRISFVQVASLFLVTLMLTPEESNINYVYKLGFSESFNNSFYPLYWFSSIFIIVVLTNYCIVYLMKKTHPNFMKGSARKK